MDDIEGIGSIRLPESKADCFSSYSFASEAKNCVFSVSFNDELEKNPSGSSPASV
jgi:hypothetical protein